MVPTIEETIMALLDFLVEPLLPIGLSTTKKIVTITDEAIVAKQVQTVVILYDYYHRKQYPELDHIEFISFCKLVVTLKPTLRTYMNFTIRDDDDDDGYEKSNFNDLQNESLSTLEKMIIEASQIVEGLETSDMTTKDILEMWPISKVAIFLIDHQQENCYLVHSSITLGIWSLIEKEVSADDIMRKKKRKRITKKPHGRTKSIDGIDHLQQLACATAMEASGCSNLRVLETHTVCSTSKPKSTTRFYIIQSVQPCKESSYIPIADVISSTQGSLVRKETSNCLTTSVVEYFHVLPYIKIISNWFLRAQQLVLSNKILIVEKTDPKLPIHAIVENEGKMLCGEKISISYKSKEVYEENHNMDLNNTSEIVENSKFDGRNKNIKVYRRRNKPLSVSHIDATKEKVDDKLLSINEKNGIDGKNEENILSSTVRDHDLIPFDSSSSKGIGMIYEIAASKGMLLSQIAYKGVLKKGDMLHDQEEINLCEENMKKILKGGDDGLASTLESIIECYGEVNSNKHQEAN